MKQLRSGFTLIEIMVTLAIIGVLCVLLFGVFGAVREKGRQRVCASNLHQWGLAFGMYIQDYDGIEPQVGVQMSHAQLGLPPSSYSFTFMKQYGIANSAVETCPSAHYSSGGSDSSTHYRKVSYILPAFADDGSYGQRSAQFGPSLVLVGCQMHNANTSIVNQPSWATMWVQYVRIDQQIVFKQVPASQAGF